MRIKTGWGWVLAAMLFEAAGASAQAPCYVAYIHGRNSDQTWTSEASIESQYWAVGGMDSATYWGAERRGCTVRRIVYNGTRGFFDAEAANTAATQLNEFISAHSIPDNGLIVIGHSMGGLLGRWIMNNGEPNAPFYNRGIAGQARGGSRDIPQDNSNWTYYDLNVRSTGTVSGNMYAWVDIAHTYRGDLEVEIGHNGTWVRIWNRAGGDGDDIKQNFTLGNFNGLPAGGVWQLRVRDLDGHFWSADTGSVEYFSIHIDTAERGSSCNADTNANARHCDFARIARKTAYLITMQSPGTGVKASDALAGEADATSNTVGDIIQFLGIETYDRAAQWMRRSALEYGSASGSWMGDGGRTTPIYTVSSWDSDNGVGMVEDTGLDVIWEALYGGADNGDGLVEEVSARLQYMRSGSSYGESGMPSSGVWRSWASNQWVGGARMHWMRYRANHNCGRIDERNDQIDDNLRVVSTSSWPYYYIGNYGLSLPTQL